MVDSEGDVPQAYSVLNVPDHLPPANQSSTVSIGVDCTAASQNGLHADDSAGADPESFQDLPELISDEEGDIIPLPTYESDEQWRQAILSFKVKGDLSTPSGQPCAQSDDQNGRLVEANSDSREQDQLKEQNKLEQDGKMAADEKAKKADADAEAMRNLELLAEERRRLRAQQGLDGTGDQVAVARCALRPGVAEDAVCEKADDGCAIKGSERYLKMVCTEGCTIHYHYACWRAFERVYKVQHPDFNWKSKDGVRCFTDGCTGAVKLALELQLEWGTEVSRRELLRLPDEPKRAAVPAAPPIAEPKKGRRQRGAQKTPAADADEGKARADRPMRQDLAERAPVQQAPEIKAEAVASSMLDFPEIIFVQKRKDDEDDLERLEKGLKGKKEKKKREKNGKEKVILVNHYDAEEEDVQAPEPSQPRPQPNFAEFFGVPEEERAPGPKLNSTEFPGLDRAAPASPEPARKHATWDTLLALQSTDGEATPHLLVQNMDIQSLQPASKPPAAELERIFSQFGKTAALVFLLGRAAAAVSYLSSTDAEKAFFELDGQLLEKKRLQLTFLRQFPSTDLIAKVAAESRAPALQKRAQAEGPSKESVAAEPKEPSENDKKTMQGLKKGAELMGLAPAAEWPKSKLRLAAREFVPTLAGGSISPSAASLASADNSRHTSFDGPLQAAPSETLSEPATPSLAPGEPHLDTDLGSITCLHLLACDEDVLAQYNKHKRFGICLDDLADADACKPASTGLVLYHIVTRQLHGIWRAERFTYSPGAGQVIAFNELHKFPAIGLQTCARCFELEEDGSLKHPQYVSGDVAQRCIKEFQMATSDAASVTMPAAKPVSPAQRPPAAPAPADNPLAMLLPNLLPKEAPAAPAPQPASHLAPHQPLPAPAAPIAVPAMKPVAAGLASSSAAETPRPGSSSSGSGGGIKIIDRAAALTAFYGTSPESRAISQALQKHASSRESSPRLDGPAAVAQAAAAEAAQEQTLSAAALNLAAGGLAAGGSAAKEAAAEGSIQNQAPAPAPAKPPVRLLVPGGRPAYRPLAVATRPYRLPIAPVSPRLPAPTGAQQQHQQQQQPLPPNQQQGASFTDMLLSTIQHNISPAAPTAPLRAAAPSTPSQPPVRPPTPASPSAHVAPDHPVKKAPSEVSSKAGSTGSGAGAAKGPSRPACKLCQKVDANYVALPCKHWGPCCDCVPTAQDVKLYPTCLHCKEPASILLRVFHS